MDAVFRTIDRGRASPDEFERQITVLGVNGKFDPRARNKNGEGLIEAALNVGAEFATIKTLVSSGCDLNAKHGQNGWTPLMQAIASNYRRDLLKQLLTLGADPSICCDSNGYSALHWAAKANNQDAIELLLATGCPVDQRSATTESALHVACEARSEDSAEILIAQGADLNLQNKAGENPLLVAVRQELPNIVHFMLATKSIDIRRAVDLQGNSPLHLARLKEQEKLAQLLIDYGFSSRVKNMSGQSADDIQALSREAKKLEAELKTHAREEKRSRQQRERDNAMQSTEVTKFLTQYDLRDVAQILFDRKVLFLNALSSLDDMHLKKLGLTADQRRRLLEALRQHELDIAEQGEREHRKQFEAAMMRRRWRQCIGTLATAGLFAVALILFQIVSHFFGKRKQLPPIARRFEFQGLNPAAGEF